MEQDGFSWWKNRIRKSASLYDVIRIDHFIGVVRYYNIPADGEPKNGFYLEGPGKKLVDAIDSARGNGSRCAGGTEAGEEIRLSGNEDFTVWI